MRIVIFGTFDLVHAGHVHVLTGLAELGELVVALGADARVFQAKGKWPILSYVERHAVLHELECVHQIIPIAAVPDGLSVETHHMKLFQCVGADAVGVGVGADEVKETQPLTGVVPEIVIPKRILSTSEILDRIRDRRCNNVKCVDS